MWRYQYQQNFRKKNRTQESTTFPFISAIRQKYPSFEECFPNKFRNESLICSHAKPVGSALRAKTRRRKTSFPDRQTDRDDVSFASLISCLRVEIFFPPPFPV